MYFKMDINQDKINKIYNYKLYKLPIEIIYKIIHKLDNMQDLINFYENIDNDYIIALGDSKENYYFNLIKYKYKKIIKTILKCYKCRYDFNLDDVKHAYICIYCNNYFCKSCCVDCKNCKIYDGTRYYSSSNRHCFECSSYHCFLNISMDLKRIKYKDDKKMENIKKRLIKSYLYNIEYEHRKYRNKNYFIDMLNISDDLKSIIKLYINEL